LARPEVTAAIIATDEHLHVEPILAAVERGVPMLIEKPLATDLAQSARVLKAITDAKLDVVVGYTQRFRRKWLAGKEKVRTGALGDVTMVTSRAYARGSWRSGSPATRWKRLSSSSSACGAAASACRWASVRRSS